MIPSKRLLSSHPFVSWILDTNQMQQISSSVQSIIIQGGVGRNGGRQFTLSNLPSLTTLGMGCGAFYECHSIVIESRMLTE